MAVTINGDGVVDVGGNASSAAYVRLYEDSDNGTNYVDLIAPASVASNRTITLPDNTGTMLTSASSITASQLPAGSVLQVVSATKTDTASTTSNSFADITGMSVSITPTSTSNKILVLCSFNGGSTANNNLGIQLVRNSTAIGIGTTATNNQVNVSGGLYESDANSLSSITASVLDSPNTTSATTYKVQFRVGSSGTSYINRPGNDTNDNFIQRAASTITVMEIAA